LSATVISLLRICWVATLLLAVSGLATPAAAQFLNGKVISVADGDTLTILADEQYQYRVRLAEIDAPESGQPFAQTSRQMLANLAFGRQATVRVVDLDRYGRTVGRVRIGSVDVNAEMVKQGGAWAFRQYQSDQRFQLWEKEARAAKRGLWGLQADQIIAPWDWRAGRRARAAQRAQARSPARASAMADVQRQSPTRFQCGAKTYCREMVSCDEAMFHLNQCGLSRLDGDSDGVPCEKLCR
jgi:endonuclease YncB( thermonuclease family)